MTELDTTMEDLDRAFEDDAEDAVVGEVVDEEVDEEVDTDAEDEDFEYDDDGNIIIPEGDEEAKADDADDGEGLKPDDAKADDAEQKDEEKEQLKAEVSRIKAQAKATLEKLGVKIENDDVFGGLVKLAAEAEDTTPEEYLKKQAEDVKLEAAKRLIAQQEGEALRRADLEELHRLFPETAQYDDVSKLPHYKEFAQKRMSGANAEKAYKETHVDEIVAHAVSNANKNSLKGTKDHLRSTVPVGAKDDAITMNKKELAEMRELFPDMKDKEIVALYKKTKGI